MENKTGRRTTTGWLAVVGGILWGITVVLADLRSGAPASRMIGGVTVPILLVLFGLYWAGVIKKLK